jgi:manganese-dependent inorganic pyrophosphatase
MAKETVYVIGHISPDTDTVCASIAYAEYLKKKERVNAIPAVCGNLNPETKFVLNYFKVKPPKTIGSAAQKTLVLVDHNEEKQMADGADSAKIIEVLDHHKIGFECPETIKFHTEPVGSTSTLVAQKMRANKFKITKPLAGILVSAILSDTVVFKASTTTPADIKIAKALAKIAGIANLKKYGIEIKKQKASLKGMTASQILCSDLKTFDAGGKKFGIGQIEVVEVKEAGERSGDILKEMETMNQKEGFDFSALMVTDIINEGSELLVSGDASYIEKAFGSVKNNSVYVKGMLSRKKDLLPPLLKTLE